jgi:hypothetical protein
MKISVVQRQFVLLVTLVFFAGCSTITPFSPKAYEQATSLKVDALSIMDKASEPFSNQKQSIDALKLDVEKAYEYAKGRPQNEVTTKQWSIIKDPARNSLGGFLKRWEDKSTLDKPFIQEAKGIVSDGFDAIIELESGKRKPNDTQK